MYKFYKGLMSKNAVDKVYHALLPMLLENMNKYQELDTPAINGRGLGTINFSETMLEIDNIKTIIEKDFGNEYEFTHSYIRLYPNSSVLNPHIDREGLDLTLSVNIYKHPDTSWPFNISKIQIPKSEMQFEHEVGDEKESYVLLAKYLKEFISFETEPGDGVCCTRDHVHWRDFNTLSFEGDHFVQCFYHWKLKS